MCGRLGRPRSGQLGADEWVVANGVVLQASGLTIAFVANQSRC